MNFTYKKIVAYLSFFSIHLVHATVQWSGTSCPDVIDQDIIINGDCQMKSGYTSIKADLTNLTITIPHDTVISSMDPVDNSTSKIELATSYPYSITIVVKKKLTFKGAAGVKENPLQIFVTGSGSVRWIIEEDGKLSFTGDDNGGSAELWTELSPEGIPSQSIIVHHKKQVHFGQRSKWGYRLFDCTIAEGKTVIEHHNTFIAFKDLSSFALEAYPLE